MVRDAHWKTTMKKTVSCARIFTLEGHDHLDQILQILRDEENITGVTISRGIAGYGDSDLREVHSANLLTLSLELPLIVDFYDESEKVLHAIEVLQQRLNLDHIVSWPAALHSR